jgi:hypothetical protein
MNAIDQKKNPVFLAKKPLFLNPRCSNCFLNPSQAIFKTIGGRLVKISIFCLRKHLRQFQSGLIPNPIDAVCWCEEAG